MLVGIPVYSAGLSTTNLTWSSLGLNLCLHGHKPATNRLLRTDIHLNGVYSSNSYVTDSTVVLHWKDGILNVVGGGGGMFFVRIIST
jgi:hypothetical protein